MPSEPAGPHLQHGLLAGTMGLAERALALYGGRHQRGAGSELHSVSRRHEPQGDGLGGIDRAAARWSVVLTCLHVLGGPVVDAERRQLHHHGRARLPSTAQGRQQHGVMHSETKKASSFRQRV